MVPLNGQVEAIHTAISWADELRELFEQKQVVGMVIRGVKSDGETFEYTVIPDTAPTIRYCLIGLLTEAISDLTYLSEPER